MALEEGRFFRGAMTDKRFEADGMAAVFRRFLPSGVWKLGSNLQVTAGGGMTVAVGYGYGLVDGYPYGLIDNSTGTLQLELEAADALPRIDRVVVKADTISLRVYAYIKRGTSAEAPAVPALDSNEISLARIAVAAGASEILAVDITEDRTVILPMNGYLPLAGGNVDALTIANNMAWHTGNLEVESGDWAPTLFGETSGIATLDRQQGYYSRCGNIVTANFRIRTTSVSAISGNVKIGGLPFVTTSVSIGAATTIWASHITATGLTGVLAQLSSSSTSMYLQGQLVGSNNTSFTGYITDTNLSDAVVELRGNVTYECAA